MRPIKFRAWDKIKSRMVYPNKLDDDEFEWLFIRLNGEFWLEGNPWKNLILMQFTGLLDKNGKEVFESDLVVRWNNKSLDLQTIIKSFGLYTVVWREDLGSWDIERKDGLFQGGSLGYEINKYEVIGNIYENPELLK